MSNTITNLLLSQGLQSRQIQISLAGQSSEEQNTPTQPFHDDLNANVNLQRSDTDVTESNPIPVAGTAASGATSTGNPVLIGAVNGSNARSLTADTDGRLSTTGDGRGVARTSAVLNTAGTTKNTISSSGEVMNNSACHFNKIIISLNGITSGDNHYIHLCDQSTATGLSTAFMVINLSYNGTTVIPVDVGLNNGLAIFHTLDFSTASQLTNVCVTTIFDSALS